MQQIKLQRCNSSAHKVSLRLGITGNIFMKFTDVTTYTPLSMSMDTVTVEGKVLAGMGKSLRGAV